MMTEEAILFPAIRRTESSGAVVGRELAAPIRVMEHEHDAAGDALARMRTLSSGFTTPDDACTSFRALLDGLRELEEDMQVHVHKENNVLFPRLLALVAL
jgi:regulator of cell morphogenesis and NO signaling